MTFNEKFYHYYDAAAGPFRSLSDLQPDEAERVQQRLREERKGFASKRGGDYMKIRRELEERAKQLFMNKGGQPVKQNPHYMTLGACDWLLEWYPQGRKLSVEAERFDPLTVSFTYGDLFPAMRITDGQPFRGQVYTMDEIGEVIHRFGWPQRRNADGRLGPERYIEAQIWDEAPLEKYKEPGSLHGSG